jgi:hypothetical protein
MRNTTLVAVMFLFSATSQVVISPDTSADQYIRGYIKKDGTYVQPHHRSDPDGHLYNNYSYPGNTNPYTGKRATADMDSYLNNYNKNKSYDSYRSFDSYDDWD